MAKPLNRNSPTSKKVIRRKPASVKKKAQGFSTKLRILLFGLILILLSPVYYGYVLKGLTSVWQHVTDWGDAPGYRTYNGLGIRIPAGYSIHGIDVSSYQGKIDWQKIKLMKDEEISIKFAFIKATEGLFHVDKYFSRNWREAPKAGIICGAYHYLKPKRSGKAQARFFLQTVNFEKGDLPPVVDIEELSGTNPVKMRKELKAFVDYVENKIGIKPIIYTGMVFYKDYLQNYFEGYPLWIAHYYKAELKTPAKTKWWFWQHSDNATVAGTGYVTDMNVFNGDSVAFKNLLIR